MSGAVAYVRGISPDRENREKDDFYPTPPAGTEALLSVEAFDGSIWEPACGDGAISRVLEAAGHNVISTDLVDRDYGESRIDFLMEHRPRAPNIITNPPFKLADQFVEHALHLADRKVCMLARLAFLEGAKRKLMYKSTPIARVWVFGSRLSMARAGEPHAHGGGMIAFAWFVWEQGHEGPPTLGWV